MKVQCPACREIVEMVEFSTSEEGLGFTCGNCNKANFLANPQAAGPAETEQPPAAPAAPADESICPKCGHGQTDTYACHRCGLVFEKFDQSKLPPDPEEAASLWREVQLLPSQARHQAFLDACLKADRPDYAARQYRQMSREPSQKAVAEKMLEQLLKKAQARLAPAVINTEGRRGKIKKKSKIMVRIIMAVLLMLFLYYFITMTDMSDRMTP